MKPLKRTATSTVVLLLASYLVLVGRALVSPANEIFQFLLGQLFILLSLLILVLWVWLLVSKGIKWARSIHWGMMLRKQGRRVWWWIVKVWPWKRKPAKQSNDVSVQKLADLCIQMKNLRLAIYGITPEQEEQRLSWFYMSKKPVAELILPERNRAVYGEYARLMVVLDMAGFPEVGRLSIDSEHFTFLKEWADEIQRKITHAQLPTIVAGNLSRLSRDCQQLFSYPTAATTPEYFRLAGAIALLERMSQDSRVPVEVLDYCSQRLLRDLSTLHPLLHEESVKLVMSQPNSYRSL